MSLMSLVNSSDSLWLPPDISQAAFVAANATVMGQVTAAAGSSIWYGAVIRGDLAAIQIGAYTNIQDAAVIHCDPGLPTVLEDSVTVGHRAVIHSGHIEHGSLIGIGAIVLNGVRIGAGSIIGAGAVVTKDIPAKSLAMGLPAKVIKPVSDEQLKELLEHAHHYFRLAQAHAGKGRNLGFEV